MVHRRGVWAFQTRLSCRGRHSCCSSLSGFLPWPAGAVMLRAVQSQPLCVRSYSPMSPAGPACLFPGRTDGIWPPNRKLPPSNLCSAFLSRGLPVVFPLPLLLSVRAWPVSDRLRSPCPGSPLLMESPMPVLNKWGLLSHWLLPLNDPERPRTSGKEILVT